jgi:hypothetical protein
LPLSASRLPLLSQPDQNFAIVHQLLMLLLRLLMVLMVLLLVLGPLFYHCFAVLLW